MSQEKLNSASLDWEKIAWEKTPYEGVCIFTVDEENDPNNPKVPKYTVMALKVDPNYSIPLHKHNRESGWRETLTFPKGGNFEIKGVDSSKKIASIKKFIVKVLPNQAFGLKNNDSKPLFFYSRMQPGFTGYKEIEEIKEVKIK